ncbi:hypothetical protein KLI87_22025 [Actinomadura sp. NEAU-AAG7]|nr:hypothetical protein [Actinomadura sp. NEAU-AAG7]
MTDRSGVVVQGRRVISLSVRMAEAVRFCTETERELVVAGGANSRLTLPMRLALGPKARWAVKGGGGGYYDGLSGLSLEWDGHAFVPGSETHPEFANREVDGLQLLVSGSVLHEASEGLVVGGFAEAVCRFLSGEPPWGWGASEPAGSPWRQRGVTSFCRGRAPRRAWVVFVGASVVGVLEVERTASGVREAVALGAGCREVPELGGLVGEVASRYGLVSLTAQVCPGPGDLTSVPWFCGAPSPVGIGVPAHVAGSAEWAWARS